MYSTKKPKDPSRIKEVAKEILQNGKKHWNWAKKVQFSKLSNPLNQNYLMPMVFAHAQKVSLIFLEGVTQAVFQE